MRVLFGARFVSAACDNSAMYSSEVRLNALALMGRGLRLRSISMSTGVNRATLREWREHPEKSAKWQRTIVRENSGHFARGLFHSDGYRGINRVRAHLVDGDRWYEYPRYLFTNESKDILRLCSETLDQLGVALGWPGASHGGTPYPWRAGKRWRGLMSSSGPSTD